MSSLDVRVLESPEQLLPLRGEWDRLLAVSVTDNLFLTWEWLVTWWKHLGRHGRLSLITVREDGVLVAVAPLMIAGPAWSRAVPFRRVQFLGSGNAGSDDLDVIAREEHERIAAAAIAAALAERRLMLDLSRVSAAAPVARLVASGLSVRGWRVVASRSDVCPVIDFEGQDWDGYLAGRGREHRYSVRRKLRAIHERFRVRYALVDDEIARRPALDTLFRLHDARWRPRGGSDALHTDGLRAFHEELSRLALERGWLRLGVLTLDDAPVAAVYGFSYAGRFYFYQSGFDPAFDRFGVGTVALSLSIRAALEEGVCEYDFLHGDEPYKFHWATRTRSLLRIEAYPPRTRGQVTRRFLEVRKAALRVARGGSLTPPPEAASPRHRADPRVLDGATGR